MFSLKYTPEALLDMNLIWEDIYAVSKNYDIADRYIKEFADTISKKKLFPASGIPLLYRGLFTGFYTIRYKKYIAFYRINNNSIEVIRFIMAKCDYMAILFGEDEE